MPDLSDLRRGMVIGACLAGTSMCRIASLEGASRTSLKGHDSLHKPGAAELELQHPPRTLSELEKTLHEERVRISMNIVQDLYLPILRRM
ncbi:hypothetical protein TNCV_2166741 [Trichonephila clavipes]|nr:hypothetical protein TNCV_2166741 [Trichonephila clavipes]